MILAIENSEWCEYTAGRMFADEKYDRKQDHFNSVGTREARESIHSKLEFEANEEFQQCPILSTLHGIESD
jgi:hypothetical protein